ncbi:GNAT family N-acetyltransferase [Pokkaliibacter sp. MBI-7]|uniref:GNAT family N-acetyltransferase n=1 Tax=Pokkaliibacter sp. MBI-7 TaxID=3040600 RepID=UPI002448587D|nr:GNAT family N-acetyltransferase [Pokkaliibacter sp. MBI-7]MDH2436367.1 GNAT family N-acetyltransferase [Pokkaliibacter sp. MBI-7]
MTGKSSNVNRARWHIVAYQASMASTLADLFTLAVQHIDDAVYSAAEKAAWAPQPPDYERWQQRLAGKRPWVAVCQEMPIGFIELDADGHIDCAYVHPDWQRCGVMTALYRFLETAALVQGLGRLYVDASEVALSFFAGQGFTLLSKNHLRRGEQTLVNYRMEKCLTAKP